MNGMMNGVKRSCTPTFRQTTEPSGSSPAPTDRRSSWCSSTSPGTSNASVNATNLNTKRSSWPLNNYIPELDSPRSSPSPSPLDAWLATTDRLERIRVGGSPVDTRVLGLGALDTLIARLPGVRRDGAAAQVALVFDDARGTFPGWRPKVASWPCTEGSTVWEQALGAL
ncbi:hypothetical protein QQZ08_004559 [Neonectria magnoliae]|uniref:Uncharacterized protein n=1 Tax=Neonectria magnoliae TaxID=2732573 RepID=A0ABR1I7Y5_9HYPO